MTDYFSLPEISNSDLSKLKMQTSTAEEIREYTQAMHFGRLFDWMLTEPDKLDFLNKRMPDGTKFSDEDYATANKMVKAVKQSQWWVMLKECSMQEIFKRKYSIKEGEVSFELNFKCKYDFWHGNANWGGDFKTTAATNQKQFENQIHFSDIDRQRSLYMDISTADKDLVIGISKKNFQLFPVRITRGDKIYNMGKIKYTELAWRWYSLFGEVA